MPATLEQEMTMSRLIRKLNQATITYDEGYPIISDKEWDDMYFKLIQLEKETGTILPDSPTQKINYEVVSELKKVKHNHPMLSLDKTKNIKEVESFLKGHDWIAMAKMDGLTCSLRYINGELVSAETRGNGIEGEDITHNAKIIKSIPNHINFKGELIVDGEIICTYNDFKPFEDTYKNPRNFAAGSIRLLNSKECYYRNLTFVAWDVIKGGRYEYLSNNLSALRTYGFITVPMFINDKDADITIEDYINNIKYFSESLSYPIDGVVFKYDSIKEYNDAGRTEHHFKAGLAFKFYDETVTSYLRDIEWTMGRTGILTPVAIYDEIEIEGSMCNRASLHNINIMKQVLGNPYNGQEIQVCRVNQVIPQIVKAQCPKMDMHPKFLTIPKICPYCGEETEIEQENNSEILYCTNPYCNAKLINRLDHFCGKKGLDIKGLSYMTLYKLITWEWVNSISDLFRLDTHRNEWIKKAGFGSTSVDKILKAIEDSKKCTFSKFICALGIPLIGKVASEALEKTFKTYDNFKKAIEEKDDILYQIDGIGEVMIQNLLNFDYTEADGIYNNYIEETAAAPLANGNELDGKVFVITGKLTEYKNRDALKLFIESKGGKVTGSVSKNTTYLINNDTESTSTKNITAKKLGIPVINEMQFKQLLMEGA